MKAVVFPWPRTALGRPGKAVASVFCTALPTLSPHAEPPRRAHADSLTRTYPVRPPRSSEAQRCKSPSPGEFVEWLCLPHRACSVTSLSSPFPELLSLSDEDDPLHCQPFNRKWPKAIAGVKNAGPRRSSAG